MNAIVTTVLASALLIASVTDIRSRRIPNLLTFSLMLSGLAVHGLHRGPDGLLFSLAGFGLGLGLMLIPHLAGCMGGGDVKLMAAVGAWLGPDGAFAAFLLASLAGGLYALAVLAFRPRDLAAVARSIWNAFMVFLATRSFRFAPAASGQAALPRLCYGLAIAAGTFGAMALAAAETGRVAAW